MKKRPLSEIQGVLREIVADLQKVDDRLALLSERLPEPPSHFSVRAELRNALDCVRIELLGDAIATLDGAATQSPLSFLAEYRQRQKYLGGVW